MPRPASLTDVRAGRLLLDQIPAIVWTTSRQLRFTSCLGNGLMLLGLGPNQVVGTPVSDVFETKDEDLELLAAHNRALDGKAATCWVRWGERMLHAQVGPLFDGQGEVLGTVGVALVDRRAATSERLDDPFTRPLELVGF
jgi:PAS domain-containing protein